MRLFVSALVMLALAGCAPATTTLVGSWRAPSYEGTLRRPLVVAVAQSRYVRVRLEDDLVLGLRRIGVDAVASHTIFPDHEPSVPDIADELPSTDRDSMMITRLVDVKTETSFVPSEPVGPNDSWSAYYMESAKVVRTPPYTYQQKKVVVRTNLYSLANGKLVWSATTDNEAAPSLDSAISAFVDVVVADAEKSRVFGA